MSNHKTSDQENQLRLQTLKNRGKLLAGFTHDLKNQLAIINESNGLLQDYLAMGKAGSPDFAEKVSGISSRVEQRVQIAAKMCQALNSYAHRTDASAISFSVNDFLEEMLVFLERFARLEEIHIRTTFPEDHAVMTTEPSLLQFVVSRMFFTLLEMADSKAKAQLELQLYDRGSEIQISLILDKSLQDRHITDIDPIEQLALEKLGGTLETVEQEGQLTLLLHCKKM